MDGGKKVWAPHATDGFILGTIADISETDITVEPLNKEKVPLFVFVLEIIINFFQPVPKN